MARVRAAGRTLEEAEDLIHDVYAETIERLPVLPGIRNLPAWINSLLTRRMIDLWRHDRVRAAASKLHGRRILNGPPAGEKKSPPKQIIRKDIVKAFVCEKNNPPEMHSVNEVENSFPKENEVLVKVFATSATTHNLQGMMEKPFFIRVMSGALLRPRVRIKESDFSGRVEAVGGK